jgi:serine/threonine protein kinase
MLGKGRIGTVYQAIDLDKQMPVALKVIAEQLGQKPEFRQRFLREVRLLPRLEHPSIVAIEEVGVDRERDLLYMVTQYVTGGTLTAYLQQLSWQDKVMRPGEALLITAQVAEALDYAHEKGVLHRDIRPNIILFREEEEWRESEEMHRRAVISDFGIASLLEIEKEPLLQSLQYMSPEQCLGKELDGRSDLYSLGVLLYQITVGRLPFAISSAKEAVEKHAYEDPPPPRQIKADLPLAVENVILTAIAKRPQDRFQTGAEMAEVLRQTVAALPQALAVLAPEEGEHEVDTVAALPAGIGQGIVNEDQVTITQEMPHRLSRRIITIGRSESNDIVLAAPTVTRRHAQLERTAAGWQVRDLGSQNGTYLDDAPLLPDIPVRWHSHQTLRIGPYFLQLKEGKGFTYQAHALDVDVTPNEIEVPAGQARVLRVAVRNLTAEEQEFALTMERVPPEWEGGSAGRADAARAWHAAHCGRNGAAAGRCRRRQGPLPDDGTPPSGRT